MFPFRHCVAQTLSEVVTSILAVLGERISVESSDHLPSFHLLWINFETLHIAIFSPFRLVYKGEQGNIVFTVKVSYWYIPVSTRYNLETSTDANYKNAN